MARAHLLEGYVRQCNDAISTSPNYRHCAEGVLSFANEKTIVGDIAGVLANFAAAWAQTNSDFDSLVAMTMPPSWTRRHLPVISTRLGHVLYIDYNPLEPEGKVVRCPVDCEKGYATRSPHTKTFTYVTCLNCNLSCTVKHATPPDRRSMLGRAGIVKAPFPRPLIHFEWKKTDANSRGRNKSTNPAPNPTPSIPPMLSIPSSSRGTSRHSSPPSTPSVAPSSPVETSSRGSSQLPLVRRTRGQKRAFDSVGLSDDCSPAMDNPIPSTSSTPSLSLQYIALADDKSSPFLAPPQITTRSRSLPSGLDHGSNLRVANPGTILVPPVLPGRSQSGSAPPDEAEASTSTRPPRKKQAKRQSSSSGPKKRGAK